MAILSEPKTWRRPRSPNAREPDLSPDQTSNVRKSVAYLRVRLGGLKALAKAAGLTEVTVGRASTGRGPVSARTALRIARVAGVSLEDVIGGKWPGERCPHCYK